MTQTIEDDSSDLIEDRTSIVMDNGSKLTKVGFSGDDSPRAVFPTVIGYPRYAGVMVGIAQNTSYVGDEAMAKRGILKMNFPVRNGIVDLKDMNSMEQIWRHTFGNELHVEPSECALLQTEPEWNPTSSRIKITEIMFEEFSFSQFYMANQSSLALYASGKTTGLVLNCGEDCCSAVPIYNGKFYKNAVSILDIGGSHLNNYLYRLITEQGYSTTGSADSRMIMRHIKEKICYIAHDYQKELLNKNISKDYVLPDGCSISVTIGTFQCPEALFQPNLLGIDQDGVDQLVYKTAMKIPTGHITCELLDSIVLCGGTSMFNGFDKRLQIEIEKLFPKQIVVDGYLRKENNTLLYQDIVNILYKYSSPNVNVIAPPERKYSIWIGGSILSSLSTFDNEWITREQYNEYGADIINKSCNHTIMV